MTGIFLGKYGYSKYRSTTFQDFLIGNFKKLQNKLFSGLDLDMKGNEILKEM